VGADVVSERVWAGVPVGVVGAILTSGHRPVAVGRRGLGLSSPWALTPAILGRSGQQGRRSAGEPAKLDRKNGPAKRPTRPLDPQCPELVESAG